MLEDFVSRETQERLQIYNDLLEKWSDKINLIAPSTKKDIQKRHIEDSAQLYRLLPTDIDKVVDIGSGGGLPGIVLSIMSCDRYHVELIESDTRKCVFLNEVCRRLDLRATVTSQRIELVERSVEVLTARALAPVTDLLEYSQHLIAVDGVILLLKGKRYEEEIQNARKLWDFKVTVIPSATSEDGVVLKIEDVSRVV